MSKTSNSFYRTARNEMTVYNNDGSGRDGYISYNNGGYWKEGMKPVPYSSIHSFRSPFITYHSLNRKTPPFRYICDGSGRDGYVKQNEGGLVSNFKSLANQTLNRFLRENDDSVNYTISPDKMRKIILSKSEISHLKKIRKIEKDVVKRLYYKCGKIKIKKKNEINNGNNSVRKKILGKTFNDGEMFNPRKNNFIITIQNENHFIDNHNRTNTNSFLDGTINNNITYNNNINESNNNENLYDNNMNNNKQLLFNKIKKINLKNNVHQTLLQNYNKNKTKPYNDKFKLKKERPYLLGNDLDGASFRKQKKVNKLGIHKNMSALDLNKLGIDFVTGNKDKKEKMLSPIYNYNNGNNKNFYMNNNKSYKVKVIKPEHMRIVNSKALF